MNVKWIVELTESERDDLVALTRRGKPEARKIKRAHILLLAHEGYGDEDIAVAARSGTSTVYRTKRKFVEGGVEHALSERRPRGGDHITSGEQEAMLVALACSEPPTGRARWTLKVLADEWVQLTDLDSVSADTVRRRLAENELKPWRKRMWCIRRVDAEFVARMEEVLDLYT